MKLHLPVGLRAALLAVLLCSPMAMGNVSVYHVASDGTHRDVSLEDEGDGKAIIYGDIYNSSSDQEHVIFVDGKTDGNSFTALECKTLLRDCMTTVTVGQGGALQFTSGSYVGFVFDGPSSETVVNIDGGTLDAGFSSLSLGTILNIAPKDAKTTVAITLENGGSFSIVTPHIGDIDKNSGSTPMGGTTTVSIEARSGSTLKLGTNQTGSIANIENDGSKSVTTISIDGEGTTAQLYAMYIGRIDDYAQNASSTTKLSVTDHAEFSMTHGGSIGCLEEYDSTAHTDIVVSGGARFTGEGDQFSLGSYSYSSHSTTLQSYAGEVEMNISVTKGEGQEEGGHFTMKSGLVGWCGGIDSKTLGDGVAPKTSLTITVDGGTFSVEEDPNNGGSIVIGGVNDTIDTHKGVGVNETEITVSNEGVFTIDCRQTSKYTGRGKFLLGDAAYTGATVESYTLNVSDNGKFIMTAKSVTDDQKPGTAYLGRAYDGGNVEKLEINISTGGSLSIIPSTSTNTSKAATQGIGFAETASSGVSSSITTEINLQDGGKMDIAAAQKDTAPSGIGDVIAKKGGTATANTSISVGGKDSSFTFTSGDIGMVYVASTSTGTANTSITVEEGGTFTMTGGRLGYSNVGTANSGTVSQDLFLKLNGGKMEITGGSIFEKSKNTASSSTRTGSIELSGDSVLTIGEGVTIGSDVGFAVTMHGGKLAGEGISKLTEKVSTVTIDTGDQFKGEIGLGGIGAEKITSIKINSGDIAIVDIGEGTLTLGAEDILTVGENSAWDGKDVSPAPGGKQALLQFKTEKSGSPSEGCTVDVNGKVTLNFDGQYLAEQKGEDGTVTLRVWITNGKLAGEGETSTTWAEEHFTIGTGWGLAVTSYDADQGMLILEGTSTVWVATVDGDDGNRHAAADASALEEYTKVIVDEGTTFTADGDATIQQLEGRGKGSQLELVKGTEGATITLNNVDKETGDTVFESSISAQEGVNLRKTGDASLTVQGTLQAGGDVTVAQGTLTLGDGENSIGGALTVGDAESGTSGTLDVQGNLSAKGAVKVAAGELVLEGDNNTVEGALSMGAEGKLQVKRALTLSGTSDLTAGTLTGEGTITVAKENGNLTVGNSEVLDKGLSLQVEGSLTLRGKQQRGTEEGEGTITGSGTLTVDKEGQLSTGSHLNMGISGVDVQGILSQGGGQIAANNIVVEKDGTYELKDGTINALPQGDAPGTLSLNVAGAFEMSGGEVTDGTFTLSDNASLTQSNGTIDGGSTSITLSDRATMEQTGGQITGSTFKLSDHATMTQSGAGTINGSSITLSGGATMKQDGGQITGGTLDLSSGATLTQSNGTINGTSVTLNGEGTSYTQSGGSIGEDATFLLKAGATLTQSNGTIDGASITLSGGATMEQTGGEIIGGKLELSGGAKLTQSDAGTISGSSITLSGEDTGFTQAGGSIGEGATFSLKDGATLTLSGGSMNGAVTMEGEASLYDLGNQAAKGDIIMHGGSLANAGNYAGSLAIQTDATYTGAVDLGGVDAARITQVRIGASETELRNLKSGSTLTFREGDAMVVGVQHVYREGQPTPERGSMVQFQEGKGQIAFDENSALRLHLKSEVLKDLEGQLEILFTNGSFSGMPEGGQKELEAWLGEHFVLDAGLEDIKVLLLNDAEGGHLILTGSSSGIWIASRNGQNVDVADLLNNYSAVIADKDLTLTLPTTQEETLTIVNQLRNERETHGDFIVKTESGATAGHTVQLHNAHTNEHQDNGDTEFYGNIRVEGTGLEAATLEKTGDAALNVHGNVESIGTVEVKEGTLALGGTANSIGTLAMSGGELQVNGTLALTGATEMSEGSSGSISGTGNVKLGSGASLTLAGRVSYEVQNTQLENGAQMSQKGEAAINGGSITLSGEGTSYTQEGGSISKDVRFSLSDGATLTLKGGSMNGAVTMEGKTSSYNLGSRAAQGDITMHGGSLANAGNYAGSLAIQTSDTYTGALDLGGVDAARITSIQLAGKDTYLTGLKEGSTLTLHAGDSFKVTEQNVWVDGKGGPEGKQAFFQFGTAGAGEVGTGSVVDVASGAIITLNFVGQQIAEAVGEDGGITLKVWITNGQLGGGKAEDAAETWAGEHFVIGTGWGLNVESYDADQGLLVLKGQSNIWDAKVNGDQVAGHAEANASELDLAEKVIIDENTVVAVDQNATIHQLDGEGEYSLELENKGEGDKTITLRNHGSSSSAMGSTGDTVFGGDILAGDGVNLRKTGDAALKVQGSLKAEGNVAVEEGKLVLGENGEHSIGGELSLGEHGTLQVDGSLTLSGNMNRESAGTLTGQGTVILDGENVTFGDVTLGEELTFQIGDNSSSVDFGERDVTLSNLKGNSVKGREMTLTGGEGGIYSGTVDGRLVVENNVELLGRDNEACDLVIQGTTGQATLAADSKYNSLDNGGAGGTGSTLKIASGDSSAGAQITVNGHIVFRQGAETDFTINLSDPRLWTENEEEHDATMLSTEKTIYIEDGTKFVIDCFQKGISDAKGDLTHVVILKGGLILEVEKYNAPEKNSGANRQAVYAASARAAYAMQTRAAEEQPGERQVRGAQVEGGVLFNQLYETPTMWTNGTESWINAKHRTMSPLANLATTSNSMSGLRLLWQDLNDKGLTQATQQVSEILALLDNLAATNPAAARQMMAAVAGSTLTSLSSAQNAALRNQMSRVRDHALQAARLRGDGHWENGQENVVTDPKGVTVRTAQQTLSSGSTTHAWIEGTSFFSEQHSVGDESGYRLNSWGGAVGVDKQLADNWSVGAYLSASYGDLEARAAEYAKGDMDTYAVGVWGQNHTGRWGNTLLALWAWNDASLRRMVNNGAGYAGRSDADGYSIGAQWELTYDLYMNERKTNVLQPLFSVAVMRAEMDGFSEKGAGSLGLNVKDQTRDTVTLALGARWLAEIGSGKAINRTVNTELHANVAQDLGDRRSDADVALQANPTYIRNVRGAKAGSTALQFGAGVNVPVTPNSQIYVNAGGELREHASSWNAALGVRMGF